MTAENFIPMRRRQLIAACAESARDSERFRKLCRLIEATVHHRYRSCIEELEERLIDNGRLSAVPLDEALARMDAAWDAEFEFAPGRDSNP